MHRRQRLTLGVTLVVAALVVVGCGSDASTGSGTGSDSEATVAADATVPDDTSTTSEDPSTSDDGEDVADAEPEDSSDGGTSGEPDPCAALNGVDLVALMGEPAGEPNGSIDLMGASCRVDPVSGSSAGLRLVVTDQEPADNFEQQQEVLGVDAQVDGLGDRAFHSGPYLMVLDGDQMLMIQVIRDSARGFNVPDAELEAAMRTVLSNLNG